MESTGIMQRIKDLLKQGTQSGDIIQMGFAPGTVYKVQRQFRRQAHMAQTKVIEAQATPSLKTSSQAKADVAALVDQLQQYQKENESLHSDVEHLRAVEKEANLNGSQFATLAGELQAIKAERVRSESKIIQLTYENGRLTQQLQEAQAENIDLKKYLSSKNCGWQRDFVTYMARSRIHCSLQS